MFDYGRFFDSWRKPPSEDQTTLLREGKDAANLYAIPPDLINGIKAQNQIPFFIMPLDLGTAQVNPLEINVQGTALVIRGYELNSPTQAVDTTVFVQCQFERNDGSNLYPLKHNFGFRGPFSKLYLTWPQQQNTGVSRMANLIIYKGLFQPWVDGSAAT